MDDKEETTIKIPINANSTIKEVEKQSLELVKKFEKQSICWTRLFNHKEMAELFDCPGEISEDDIKGHSEYYFYDKESKLFFLSKEHFDKLKEDKELFDKMVREAKGR